VFHDPAADNVLHVEGLIQAIGPISEDEAEWHLLQVTSEETARRQGRGSGGKIGEA